MRAYIPSAGEVETGRFQDFFSDQPASLLDELQVSERPS